MKVKCQFCQKKFDNELYSGLCPYCGHYYRSGQTEAEAERAEQTGVEQEVMERAEIRTADMEQAETESAVMSQAEIEPSVREEVEIGAASVRQAEAGSFAGGQAKIRRAAGKRHVIRSILILLILAVGGIAPYLMKRRTETKRIENTADTTITVVEDDLVTYDAVNLEGKEISYGVRIKTEKIQRDNAHSWRNIPDGYEVIRVPYEIAVLTDGGEWKKESELPEGELWLSYYDIHLRPYAVTKSGAYLEPVRDFDIQDNLGLDYDELEEKKIGDNFAYESGCIFFLVKKNDFKELFVNSYNYDSDAYQETKLRGSYQLVCPKAKK